MCTKWISVLLGLCLMTTVSCQVLLCNFDNGQQGSDTFMCSCDGTACQLDELSSSGYKWVTWMGRTPSDGTGPDADHTLQNTNGGYIYAEASNQQPGSRAVIDTPPISLGRTSCLTFFYHMYGQHIGSLAVSAHFNNGSYFTLYELVGQQAGDWLEAKIGLPGNVDRITLTATRGGTVVGQPFGDIAIDDLKIERETCPGFDTSSTTSATTTTTTTTPPTSATPISRSSSASTTTTTTTSTTTPTPRPITRSTVISRSTTASTTRSSTTASTSTNASSTTASLVSSTASEADLTSEWIRVTSSNSSKSVTTTTTARNVVSETGQEELWGLDETLWIIILSVTGVLIVVLLVIVFVQACAMRRMRSARILRQSDDYSNIESYHRDREPPREAADKRDNYINAYDNLGLERDDKPASQTNGGGLI